jgi:hypothetical protein
MAKGTFETTRNQHPNRAFTGATYTINVVHTTPSFQKRFANTVNDFALFTSWF